MPKLLMSDGSRVGTAYVNPDPRVLGEIEGIVQCPCQYQIRNKDGERQPIYDVAFIADGAQLAVTAGPEVLIYDTADGNLVRSLRGHKDGVLCLAALRNGFVSGGADKQVVIWSSKLEGVLKYSHTDTIQSVSCNAVGGHILSCTASDFGIWSPEQKNVTKYKVPSRICASSWAPDGQHFALGLFNGSISIRNKLGDERAKIERGNSAIWTLAWNPSRSSNGDVLAVGDWDQKLAFYDLNGRQVGKERALGFDPCSVSFSENGEYLVLAGQDRKATLWTSDGIRLGLICERDNWIWSSKAQLKQNCVAIGCHDGTVAVYKIAFNTVHGLHNDRYAYRENMTDVVIQHLTTDQRARIRCRDYVKKIAVYKERLAVQLGDKIIVYELFNDGASDVHYRIKDKIHKTLECNLLVVTSKHIVLCLDKKLQCYNVAGEKEREWNLDALVRYIKVIGGPRGKEGLLVGLKNGQVFQIFINNAFPIPLIKQTASIRCLDLSLTRRKLAVVDENNTCLVYDVKTKQLLYQEPDASSVAWNSELEDILCYSGNNTLSIKAGNFPPHQQKMQGFVVGFTGSRIFCLHVYAMTTVDVPQSASLVKYVEKADYDAAYKVACLGVTETDWRKLGLGALEALRLDVAEKAFARLRDLHVMTLIRNIRRMQAEGKNDLEYFMAEVYACTKRYHEAAKLYKRSGHPQKAIEMFTDLNMWEYATQIAQQTNSAQSQHDRNDPMAAAKYMKAIDILGPAGAMDELIGIVQLERCLQLFRKNAQYAYAIETLTKIGRFEQLLELHIELLHWDEAFRLKLHLPYARWLAMNDRFLEAQETYRKAGYREEAVHVLEQLRENAVIEQRYDDVAYYYWLSAREHLDLLPDNLSFEELNREQKRCLQNFHQTYRLSEVYYAYYHISEYVEQPFTMHQPETLFNMARFTLHYLNHNQPVLGISKVTVLYALTKLCRTLEAFKLGRDIYEKLQLMCIPAEWQETIEVGSLTIRSKPMRDKDTLQPICYQCSALNPLLSSKGDHCTNCLEPFVHSFYSFLSLPVVRFEVDRDITHDEASRLIAMDPPASANKRRKQMIQKLHDGSDSDSSGGLAGSKPSSALSRDDPFTRQLAALQRGSATTYSPVKVGRKVLMAMDSPIVLIRQWDKKCVPPEYYRVMVSDVPIRLCNECRHFFLEEEWVDQVLTHGHCPFCRHKPSSMEF
ncbi:hypothetical protein BC832DRAFT_598279 [Gaertneriomyces semiglobifer]|nr:hypothetical protein BC832DRAFT_598279 [Gaertneriomyces semiglobifer]